MPRILLVEDNEINRDMLSRRLERRGMTVVNAVNGAEGVSLASSELPDLILMDMSLPELDGWEATRRVKSNEATKHIPIIALTAHAMANDRERALAAGCNDYDTKPVDFSRLLGKIDAMFGRKEGSSDGPEKVVLVVDDNQMNRDMLARRLERTDRILMDMSLLEMDGWEATRRLKSDDQTRRAPVNALTAQAMTTDRDRAFQIGCDQTAGVPPAAGQDPVPAETGDRDVSQGASILVVDDDAMNRDMLSRRLARSGYNIQVAEDGPRALSLIETQPVDLVLLDQMMPGITGLEVLKIVRQKRSSSELPVIMVTAEGQSGTIVEALGLGANDYVTKPVDYPVVAARIRTHLAQKWTEEKLRESEERYALAAQGANDGLWDWNLKSGEIYFSPRWMGMLGVEEGEISTRPEEWFGRIHPDDLNRVQVELEAHAKGQTPHFESEFRMLHKTGFYRWVLSRGIAVRDAAGKPYRMAGSQRDITENKVADALTGLPNRILFADRLAQAIARSKRRKDYLFAVLFLDLDRFKLVNDSLGHVAGDELLVEISHRLRNSLRVTDTVTKMVGESMVARMGGDEFAILLDDLKHFADATRVADRLEKELERPFQIGGHEMFVTASIGITFGSSGYEKPEDLLRDADTAMYRAKSAGKARYQVFGLVSRICG